MSGALVFQKWFSRLIILFVIWNCVGLRYTVNPDVPSSQGSVSLFFKETPSLKLIYTEFR